MFNESYQTMDKKRLGDKGAMLTCRKNTEVLKSVNKKVKYFLDRLPLRNQNDVVKLTRLIEEQEKLVRVKTKGQVPLGIVFLNDNEKYRARHLSIRFRDAYRRGKIRQPKNQQTFVEVVVIE